MIMRETYFMRTMKLLLVFAVVFSVFWVLYAQQNVYAAKSDFTNASSYNTYDSVATPTERISGSVPEGVGDAAASVFNAFQNLVDITARLSGILGNVVLYVIRAAKTWLRTIAEVPVGEAVGRLWNGLAKFASETLSFFQNILPN